MPVGSDSFSSGSDRCSSAEDSDRQSDEESNAAPMYRPVVWELQERALDLVNELRDQLTSEEYVAISQLIAREPNTVLLLLHIRVSSRLNVIRDVLQVRQQQTPAHSQPPPHRHHPRLQPVDARAAHASASGSDDRLVCRFCSGADPAESDASWHWPKPRIATVTSRQLQSHRATSQPSRVQARRLRRAAKRGHIEHVNRRMRHHLRKYFGVERREQDAVVAELTTRWAIAWKDLYAVLSWRRLVCAYHLDLLFYPRAECETRIVQERKALDVPNDWEYEEKYGYPSTFRRQPQLQQLQA